MRSKPVVNRIAHGAAAGFAGTVALQGLRTASQQWLPGTMPPIREDPGEFMVHKAEEGLPSEIRDRIPSIVETATARSMAVGYGVTAGVLYALLRPDGANVVRDGIALGVGTWAVGYLGWLPALGLLPPVTEQGTREAIGPIVRHALFGIAAVAAYHWLEERG